MSSPKKNSIESTKQKQISPNLDHLHALTEFAAAAGHEINNPLAVILGRSQLLLNREKDKVKRQALETIAGQALRIRDMIGDVMLFADPPLPNRQTCNISEVIPELADNLRKQLQKQTSTPIPKLICELPNELEVSADIEQFQAVICELLRNAFHPSTESSQVSLTAQPASDQNDFLEIDITDNGRGLSPNEAKHLFDPFYSGRQAGRGLGFGLCKAWRFVTLHEGSILLNHQDSKQGVSVKILWPTPEYFSQNSIPQ
ncbi:MAG: HAMP domain-containing histidine kinase [Planctomycetaceae bacterium]|nr:HAMP domain-containing histidine kinase [Planctomycetaceae bacterium]